MPDAEHGGPGSGNQDGSGMGSGHGSGNQDAMGSGMDGWDGVNPTDDPSGLGYGSGLDGTAPAAMGKDPSGLGYGAMDGWGYAGQNQTAMDVDYSAYEGTQFSPTESTPTGFDVKQEMQFDFKNFYSALDDPDASLKSKGLEIQGFLNHISRKNYTDQGFFSKLGLLSSKLNQRQQIEQIENFMAKKGTQLSIEALNQAHSKQINENPGFRSFLPGYTAINALMTAIGLPGQHTHPDVQALYDQMEKLGMIERTRPEQESWTEAQKKAHCEAKEGWSWDSKLQACVKGGQKMLYNVHTGQYDIPPI